MDLHAFCSAPGKCLNPLLFLTLLCNKPHLPIYWHSNHWRKKWYKNYELSSLVGFWVSTALATKWVTTAWSIFNKEVLISWLNLKSAKVRINF
jgi:hypothetical protein